MANTTLQSPLAANIAIVNPDGTPTLGFMRQWTQQITINGYTILDSDISFSDITTNNASVTKHGFLPKLSGNVAQYLDGTGAWSTPAGGGITTLLWGSEVYARISKSHITIVKLGTP